VKGGGRGPNPMQRESKAANKWLASTILPGGSNPMFYLHQIFHQAKNCSMYADGFYFSLIDDKDYHIPLPLIMFTCTTLCHALLEWEKNKGFHPKASNSKPKVDRPYRSKYFKYKNDGGKIASCCAIIGGKLLTLLGVADTYTFLMNTWKTLLERYQLRVYKNGDATIKHQIQQAENPMPAVVICGEAARVDNASNLDYLTSEVVLEEPDIGSTD
jgi:hypothetical protein